MKITDEMVLAEEIQVAFERKDGQPKAAPEHNPIVKFLNAPTAGKAIKAKCSECMGCTKDRIEPGFKQSIRDCTSYQCPLYAFRPYRPRKTA